MKKFTILLLMFLITFGAVFAKGSSEVATKPTMDEVELTYDALVEAAKKEGKVVVYGTHSYIEKAAEAFSAKYGIKVEWTHLNETELISKVSGECSSKVSGGADLVFAQDGARIWGEWVGQNFVYNWKSNRLGALTGNPNMSLSVFEYSCKGFIYNNELTGNTPYLTNIWQLTDPKNYGLFSVKDPYSEGVNFNFFTMLTTEKYSQMLKKAYEDYYGKSMNLTTENAGYEFIKALYKNGIVLGTSDTKISEAVGAKDQDKTWVGLFSMQRFATAAKKNLALGMNYDMNPVAGFYYPIYSIITSNVKNLNAAKLFVEFMLSEEGWKFWDGNVGDYNANKQLAWAGNVSLEEWANVAILEDMEYCFNNRAKVEDFIQSVNK